MAVTLITGATGFVGRHLLWDILNHAAPGDRVLVLIRSRTDRGAAQRLAPLLSQPAIPLDIARGVSVEPLRGDLTEPGLGVSAPVAADLWPRLTHVVHCAASVQFTMGLPQARAINVEGTSRVLEVARQAEALRRFDYIGTAYVSGRRRGLVREERPEMAAGFHNSYEQTKAESEDLVHRAADRLPVTVFRPSIVTGDSITGATQSFNVLYWPLKVFAQRLVPVIPADRRGLVDIVPVDYVRNSIGHLRRANAPKGRIYHISCGPGQAATIGQLAAQAAREFGVWRPPFVSPRLVYPVLRPILKRAPWRQLRNVVRTGDQYLPYLSHHAQFDTANTRSDLAGSGLVPPPPAEFFHRLIAYCIETDWGARAPARSDDACAVFPPAAAQP